MTRRCSCGCGRVLPPDAHPLARLAPACRDERQRARVRAWRERQRGERALPARPRNGQPCGGPGCRRPVPPSLGHRARLYCSDPCAAGAHRELTRARRREDRVARPRLPRPNGQPCARVACGRPVPPSWGCRPRLYCGAVCRDRAAFERASADGRLTRARRRNRLATRGRVCRSCGRTDEHLSFALATLCRACEKRRSRLGSPGARRCSRCGAVHEDEITRTTFGPNGSRRARTLCPACYEHLHPEIEDAEEETAC